MIPAMMKGLVAVVLISALALPVAGCSGANDSPTSTDDSSGPKDTAIGIAADYPKIASWLAKKDDIMASGKPYDLVMSALFMPDEAEQIRAANPDVKLLAGFTTNWVWQNEAWIQTLLNVADYGSEKTFELTENMYLTKPNGDRCPFGWESETWGQEEIYAMDPTNPQWVELITSFYKTLLEQPQHDGIIIDMVIETSLCREAIDDADWIDATRDTMAQIEEYNTEDKLVIFNSGRDISEIDEFAEYMDGYVMENCLGSWGADYRTALDAAEGPYLVVYAVDTEDTGEKNLNKMRLGLTLSLLHDNTYFTYDFGPRDHGQAWWFPEYDAYLGQPFGRYYDNDGAYWREFQNGTVVSSPNHGVTVTFETTRTDVTSGEQSTEFEVSAGDGRIFLKSHD